MKQLAIITVTYNCEDVVAETIDSVLSQDAYCDIEYIIVDGGSSDRTPEIARLKGVNTILSEPDLGIYDAMNKGVLLASAPYCLFLNAGDLLAGISVASDIIQFAKKNYRGIILGYHQVRGSDRKTHFRSFAKISTTHMNFCHQAIIMPRELLIKFPFNLQYRYAADFDQLKRASAVTNIFYMRQLLSLVSPGGVSDKNRLDVLREWMAISGPKLSHLYLWVLYLASDLRQLIIKKIHK